MGETPRGAATAANDAGGSLPRATSVLAVCAHPDDEAFGLGAALSQFARTGTKASVLCFTRGEASTLGASVDALGAIRDVELRAAAVELGIAHVKILDYPDSSLETLPLAQLSDEVASMVAEVGADLLVVFDEGGITGHPDHERATAAAVRAMPARPVLAWCLPQAVAAQLERELGVHFVGRQQAQIDLVVTVDRDAQRRAIACHASQSEDNPVLWRRLELLGAEEAFRWLRPKTTERPEAGTGDGIAGT